MKTLTQRLSSSVDKMPIHLFIWHHSSPQLLQEHCQQVLQRWQSQGKTQYDLDSAQSLPNDIPESHARLGLLASNLEEACDRLEKALQEWSSKADQSQWSLDNAVYYHQQGMPASAKVVALFSGQGSQYLEMGKELVVEEPIFQEFYHAMDGLFDEDDRPPLSNIVFPFETHDPTQRHAQEELLQSTEFAQPAIGMMSAGLFRLLESHGISVDMTGGHSFGEVSALWAAGVVSDQDYLKLAKARGKAMSPPDDPDFDAGTMMAVKGTEEVLKEHLLAFPEVKMANFNSPNQLVLAGPKKEVEALQKVLRSHKVRGIVLPVSAAFHTPLVKHAQVPFANVMRTLEFQTPHKEVYSNETGQPYPKEPDAIRHQMEQHILESVCFTKEVQAMYDAGGRVFIELGPKNVLSNLAKSILGDQPHLAIALNASPKKDSRLCFYEGVLQLKTSLSSS